MIYDLLGSAGEIVPQSHRGLVIEEDNRVCVPTCSGRSSLANGFIAGFAKAEQRGERGPKSIVLSLCNELRYRRVRQWPMISESHRTGLIYNEDNVERSLHLGGVLAGEYMSISGNVPINSICHGTICSRLVE